MGNPTKLVADNQLILDAPLLKVPLELIRRNFKTAQKIIDKETKTITASLSEAIQKAQLGLASPDDTIASIDLMIMRMQTLKRKVWSLTFFANDTDSLCSLWICKQKRNFGFIDRKLGLDIPLISSNVIH